MKPILLLFILLDTLLAVQFDDYFIQKSMRIDFYHSGNTNSEELIFQRIVEEKQIASIK